MNASAPGLSRPNFLSPPSWTAIAIVAATAAAVAAVRFALPSESSALGSTFSLAARPPAPGAEQPATAVPAVLQGTSVPDASTVFRAHEQVDEPMVPTF